MSEESIDVTKETAEEEREVTVQSFSSEEVEETETKKQRLERIYNDMAVEAGFDSIEHFYVKKKFELALKWDKYSKSDDYMSALLSTIARDLWYGSSSKEFVMQNNIPVLSAERAVMR